MTARIPLEGAPTYSRGGIVETPRSAGSGPEDAVPVSIAGAEHWVHVSDMTLTMNIGGRDITTSGPGWIGIGVPGDDEHREERSS